MRRVRSSRPLLLVLALLLAGCSATLRPAPGTVAIPGPGHGAIAEAAGVRIVAVAEAWRGYPEDLGSVVTPILVVVENGSARRLGIRYDRFALESPDGRRLVAVPPFAVSGSVSVRVMAPYYPPVVGFGVAPYLSPYYPGWVVYSGDFPHRRAHDHWRRDWPFFMAHPTYAWVRLPTTDMIQRALPEGVVEPGGKITGFLYFDELPGSTRAVTFTATLVDAAGETPFGTVRIPFVVD